ncbi:hypothetical protein IKG29_02310 [Candidatus Saccharibacteria bacterium]|nr:hypothetical protein [Candidatus Saccharibacteria bacterium]
MIIKKRLKIRLVKVVFGVFLIMMGMFGGLLNNSSVYADPVEEDTSVNGEVTEETTEETAEQESTRGSTVQIKTIAGDNCKTSLGAIGWFVCPTTGKIAEAVDWLYDKIEDILIINPVPTEDGSPIYEIWKYCRGVTNIVFIIFLLVVIYSQITGLGISNYGVKKALPKLIIAAILVNLSFLICSLAVDLSNTIGNSLRGVFTSVAESAIIGTSDTAVVTDLTKEMKLSYANMYSSLAGGTVLAVGAGVVAIETGAIWMLIPTLLGAIVAVVSGLITISLRQAVVALLMMISPLAMVAYILPNTEGLFKKWKNLLIRMLVFYPMFSLLFGASQLAGFAIIASAKDGFLLMVGMAVQVFPLFFSWSLMKMSGTFLGDINARLRGLASTPLAASRAWADSRRQLTYQKNLASNNAYTPSLRLMQFMSNRRIAREEETKEHAEVVKLRGQAYAARRNYRKNGTISREGEQAYEEQARSMQYQREILRHKNNMNKGLGQLESVRKYASATQKARLDRLDMANVKAADTLKIEQARGEKIDYDNAVGFHNRMEDAMNSHYDALYTGLRDKKTGEVIYKRHDIAKRAEAEARYSDALDIMEGDVLNVQYAAATAAQAYDTQAKIIATKFQKYFELTPPTKDVMYRLQEFSRHVSSDPNFKVSNNMDAIISGLRVLNQRGDTDLVKNIIDDVLDKKYGGLTLGTHASQALASFLMFEVKDNDPFLRRFGKYINLETANAYNKNKRRAMGITYEEYIKGYHEEPDGTRMYAKKDMKKLVEGTSLDNIERTALGNLDASLKKAYTDENGKLDVEKWIKKREEIQTAIEPAFLSASLKWLSGSEQINSGVKFWTGYELAQDEDENGHVVVDDDGNPKYKLKPVWKGKEFEGAEDRVEEYFRGKTEDYLKDQTTGQILGMRTDYREALVEHLIKMYLKDKSESEETRSSREREFADREAEIQTRRYEGKSAEEEAKERSKDMVQLRREFAGRQLRKILDGTGKLEQIYATRRSGAANNAKDWLRKMLNLDNRNEIYRYLGKKNEEYKEQRQASGGDSGSGGEAFHGVNYGDVNFQTGVMLGLEDIFGKSGDGPDPDNDFYEKSLKFIVEKFGRDSIVEKMYKEFRKNNPSADGKELHDELEGILGDFFHEANNPSE